MEYEISDQPQEGYRPERTAIDGISPEQRPGQYDAPVHRDEQLS